MIVYFPSLQLLVEFVRDMTPEILEVFCAHDESRDDIELLLKGKAVLH